MAEEEKKENKRRRISEYFEIIKRGKEKLIKKIGYEPAEKKPSREQVKEENKILRNIFITLGLLVLILVGAYFGLKSVNNFDYRGVKFDVSNEGGILFYHTSFPALVNGVPTDYNVYLRNDPIKLEKDVSFVGSLGTLPDLFVLNITRDDLNCNGDGNLAISKFQKSFGALGTSFIVDPSASCDPLGRYGYLQIQSGDLSAVAQYGPSCYLLQVNNCEILEVTERLLVEGLVKKLGNE
jgi:hypothetical protein